MTYEDLTTGWDLGGGFEASIQHASRCKTRGHVCKLCIYYKNYNSLGDYVRYLLLFFSRAARKSANNSGCGALV